MKKINLLTFLCTAGIALATFSCGQSGNAPVDSPTSGSIKITVDESFAPIVDAQIQMFQNLYKYAKVQAVYKPEVQVVQDLLTDTVRFAIMARQLNDQEKAEFAKLKITPRVNKIAVDGVALILNKANTDTTLTMQQVRDIFTGRKTTWKQLDPTASNGKITIVFDNGNSSTARFIQDSINLGKPLPPNSYASTSNSNLVDYVAENQNAIGVIGVNWISDRHDSTAISFLNKVNVVGISVKENPTSEDDYVQPYQGYLAQGTYPLRREVFIVSKEARAGLGTGFASFITGDKGQRIILKSGLVPASMPVRIVGFRQ
ncbi:PstS family phosphate ABC transporter substrate-binding protein [Rufibacter glacialis]|uniref:Phosphate ABC transporter substrate-binding protein, PhoT family n=1 Tax=Rufibacter glacialis TaxID=1259555 RepID=A0A5M8QE89_9BACT|nr:substrate-binding domain-containing protein [Rufibacter glacialis]KAA6433313.1 phosphate ABC transporter substrate-binding protein, PhoT family [Rufibacter glacialis]GGK75531.1 phosphate ABC transporter substrate-binding protein [Rufibacter glacialis]